MWPDGLPGIGPNVHPLGSPAPWPEWAGLCNARTCRCWSADDRQGQLRRVPRRAVDLHHGAPARSTWVVVSRAWVSRAASAEHRSGTGSGTGSASRSGTGSGVGGRVLGGSAVLRLGLAGRGSGVGFALSGAALLGLAGLGVGVGGVGCGWVGAGEQGQGEGGRLVAQVGGESGDLLPHPGLQPAVLDGGPGAGRRWTRSIASAIRCRAAPEEMARLMPSSAGASSATAMPVAPSSR